MINLLPPQEKSAFMYASRNARLLQWIVFLAIGIIGVIVIVISGKAYMVNLEKSYANNIAVTKQSLQTKGLEETQQRVTSLSSTLKLVLQVLSKQVLFSQLVQKIGDLTPAGARLSDLRISKIDDALDLQFSAANYTTATQAHVNISEGSKDIFDKADIISIDCAQSASSVDSEYPCTITIKALFVKNNPFLLINQNESKP